MVTEMTEERGDHQCDFKTKKGHKCENKALFYRAVKDGRVFRACYNHANMSYPTPYTQKTSNAS